MVCVLSGVGEGGLCIRVHLFLYCSILVLLSLFLKFLRSGENIGVFLMLKSFFKVFLDSLGENMMLNL